MTFSSDDTQVLTGSADTTARVHGLSAQKSLKEYRGAKSYVQAVEYFGADDEKIVTGSADGFVYIFDTRTTTLLASFHPPTPDYLGASNRLSINTL